MVPEESSCIVTDCLVHNTESPEKSIKHFFVRNIKSISVKRHDYAEWVALFNRVWITGYPISVLYAVLFFGLNMSSTFQNLRILRQQVFETRKPGEIYQHGIDSDRM